MIKIAIVEDDSGDSEHLSRCLIRCSQVLDMEMHIDQFTNALDFLACDHTYYDIAFLDIEMPHMNGMELAKSIYETDKHISIVFVTNLAQYAIKGYEVNAVDYILKPFQYSVIQNRLERALQRIETRKKAENDLLIVLQSEAGVVRLSADDIHYVEVFDHWLVYCTGSKKFQIRGKLKDAEARLSTHHFSRCGNSQLVNLLHVRQIQNGQVDVGCAVLPISRGRKKQFLADYLNYLGVKYDA